MTPRGTQDPACRRTVRSAQKHRARTFDELAEKWLQSGGKILKSFSRLDGKTRAMIGGKLFRFLKKAGGNLPDRASSPDKKRRNVTDSTVFLLTKRIYCDNLYTSQFYVYRQKGYFYETGIRAGGCRTDQGQDRAAADPRRTGKPPARQNRLLYRDRLLRRRKRKNAR